MWEVEVKVRHPHRPIETRLRKLGAQELEDVFQHDSYYSHPNHDFVARDESLRLREHGEQFELTFKGPRIAGKTKTRKELNVQVSDAAIAHEILINIGFELAARIEKHRRTFEFDGALVCLDMIEGLGEFIEIEIMVGSNDSRMNAGKAQARALEIISKLGLPPETETRSYLEMLDGAKRR